MKDAKPPETRRPTRLSPDALAGAVMLLEIGAELGVVDLLRHGAGVTAARAAEDTGIPEEILVRYFQALAAAGLVGVDGPPGGRAVVRPRPGLGDVVRAAGYVSWGLRACGPLIANARAFATTPGDARRAHPRDGGLVARTSWWMSETDVYPLARHAILAAQPGRIVDLGSGSGRLLIECLIARPEATAVGIDVSAAACDQARRAADIAGVADRLQIVHRPIQSLAADPGPIAGADVIHAGWVFHDLMPDEEPILDAVLARCRRASSSGRLIVVEGVPYARAARERFFSAAYSLLHDTFMGRRLLTEGGWREKLSRAGFDRVTVRRVGLPGGRLFTAIAGADRADARHRSRADAEHKKQTSPW